MQKSHHRSSYQFGQLAVFLAGLTLCAATTHADLIQFTFTGAITEINGDVPEPWESVKLGDPWGVNYVFDSDAEDELPDDPFYSRWSFKSFTVTMAGFSTTSLTGEIFLGLWDPPPFDRYVAFAYDLAIGGDAAIELLGVDVFLNDNLPPDLDLNDFLSKRLTVSGFNGQGEGYLIYGDILTFDVRTIPVPSTLMALLIFGMGAVARRRSR